MFSRIGISITKARKNVATVFVYQIFLYLLFVADVVARFDVFNLYFINDNNSKVSKMVTIENFHVEKNNFSDFLSLMVLKNSLFLIIYIVFHFIPMVEAKKNNQ